MNGHPRVPALDDVRHFLQGAGATQSPWRYELIKQKEPERIAIARAPSSPEASPSMNAKIITTKPAQQEQAFASDEARWQAMAAGEYIPPSNRVEVPTEKAAPQAQAKIIHLPPRAINGSFKLEQNLGCELPVCAANRRAVDDIAIEIVTDDGTQWRLVRTADSKLPSPEHYPYWLWFLDRCQAAAERGEEKAPVIILDPVELFDLFGGQRGGAQYHYLDDAFERFSSLVIKNRSAVVMKGQLFEERGNLGTLCLYRSWRARPEKDQQVFDFAKGGLMPGPVLWASVRAGYLKSIPLSPLRELGYVGQRLYTYLSKHCQPGGKFVISASKLLPKIPMRCPPDQLKKELRKHHDQLERVGFLASADFEGRGQELKLVYRRAAR